MKRFVNCAIGRVRHARFLWNRICGRKSVVFECQQTRDWDFLEPVFESLSKRPMFRCYVLLNDRNPAIGGVSFKATEVAGFLLSRGVTRRQLLMNHGVRVWNADAYVTATAWNNYLPDDRQTLRIALPHGLVNKVNQFGEEMRPFDLLLSTGPLCTETAERWREHHKLCFRIKSAGYPKLDRLLGNDRVVGDVSHVSKQSKEMFTVMFAPSWGKHSALDVYGLEPVDRLLRSGFRVVIKLHPMSLSTGAASFATGGVDWRKQLERYCEDPNAVVSEVNDGDRWMRLADVMVSDVSGIAYEFLLTGKPVVFLDVPDFFRDTNYPGSSGREDDLCYWGRRYGKTVSSLEELSSSVLSVARGAKDCSDKEVEVLRQRLLYNPGKAGEAAATCIEQSLREREST